MKLRNFKILGSALFMFIFFIKMAISIAPLFSFFDSKTAIAVIMQLEEEAKSEKESPDKDIFKDKKAVDEAFVGLFEFRPFIVEINILHNLEHSLFKQVYHPVVPTPPPNV